MGDSASSSTEIIEAGDLVYSPGIDNGEGFHEPPAWGIVVRRFGMCSRIFWHDGKQTVYNNISLDKTKFTDGLQVIR